MNYKKIKLNLIAAAALAFLPSCVLAAPAISSVSGDYTDGSAATISGSDLGTNVGLSNLEWLGGKNGFIENGTNNTIPARTNWDFGAIFGDASTGWQAIKYSSAQAHSGSLSLKSSWPKLSQYASGMSYDYGSAINKIYVTWWVYFNHVDAQGQWKMWRLKPNSDLNNADGEIMSSSWFYENGDNLQALIMYFCEQSNYDQCFPGSNADLRWIGGDSVIPLNRWVRYELYAQASSDAGVRDGSFVYKIYRQDTPITTIKEDVGTVITRATGITNQWRYWHFQNYWGNQPRFSDSTSSPWASYGGRATEINGVIASDAVNDATRNLLPASPHVNDAYYFLYPSTKFNQLTLNISQAGAGSWNLAWEYWNGSNWTALSGVTDNSSGFHNSGLQKITFTTPSDWTTKQIADYDVVYYPIRARLSSFASMTTEPQASDTCTGGCGNEETIYIDDPYIQVGSEAHAELCDTATWTARKHCEVQPPTNWSNSSIALTLNKGSFNSGDTAYLYVVDSNGNTNTNGQQIVLGGNQSDTSAPNAPSGLQVN